MSSSSSDLDAFMQLKGCDDVTVSGETHDLHYGLVAAAGSVLGALLGSDQYPQAFEIATFGWGGDPAVQESLGAEIDEQMAQSRSTNIAIGGHRARRSPPWRSAAPSSTHGIASMQAPPMFTFTISKQMDTASPDLFLAWCYRNFQKEKSKTKGLFKKARVIIRKSSGIGAAVPIPGLDMTAAANLAHTFLAFRFEDVAVEQISFEVGTDTTSREVIMFSFQKMEISYIPQLNVLLPGMRSIANIKGWEFHKYETWGSSETALERIVSRAVGKMMP